MAGYPDIPLPQPTLRPEEPDGVAYRDSALIAETFTSIQGEGKRAGVPSYFVRFSGCNLRCGWCDTPYASWSPEGTRRSVGDLLAEFATARRCQVTDAVLTGGEPMLFPQISVLSRGLAALGGHVTIETAGTVIPDDGYTAHLMSISPKLASSTPAAGDPRDPGGAWRLRHAQRRLNPPVLQRLINDARSLGRDVQLKFVFTGPPDLAEIDSILAQLTGWASSDVLLMPEGISPPSAELRSATVQSCLARGWRYCSRVHIELFGNKRAT